MSSNATMNLTITNAAGSGASDDEIFVCIVGSDPSTGEVGTLDLTLSPPVLVTPFEFVNGTTSRSLTQIRVAIGSSIPIPAIQSARIYFAIGTDFDASTMSPSGPTPSKTNTLLFDQVEFDTSSPGDYNINPTSVAFYGISYTVEALSTSASKSVTVGFTQPRQTVIDALRNRSLPPAGQHSGNLGIFNDCFVTVPSPTSGAEVLRVLSPGTMALTDWGPITNVTRATQASHFFDAYVNEKCFAPNRELTFYTKMYTRGGKNAQYQIWATVNSDGSAMNLYTDAARTTPYAPVPSLGCPSTSWPDPSFTNPGNYHAIGGTSAADIDWGFVLFGEPAAPSGSLAWPWGSDPAAMAVGVSIARGVAHLDDGTAAWVDPGRYNLGNGGGVSTESMPIYTYAKTLHALALDHLAYVLPYDDVYRQNPSIVFPDGGDVKITLCGLAPATIEANGDD